MWYDILKLLGGSMKYQECSMQEVLSDEPRL